MFLQAIDIKTLFIIIRRPPFAKIAVKRELLTVFRARDSATPAGTVTHLGALDGIFDSQPAELIEKIS